VKSKTETHGQGAISSIVSVESKLYVLVMKIDGKTVTEIENKSFFILFGSLQGRIKRIMQADEEVGKIAQAVPVIISRTLELFVESLLKKSSDITNSRNAKTLSPSHLKQCIMSESRFDFLKDLVKTVPDISMEEGCGEVPQADAASSSSESRTYNLISYDNFRHF
jgi:hypothetical protein